MSYFIAIPSGDKYVIMKGESFNIRSNATKYAERMGWRDFFIATDEQRAMIEAGAEFDSTITNASSPPVIGAVTPVINVVELPELDTTWMKKEGIPWDKNKRKGKKKVV